MERTRFSPTRGRKLASSSGRKEARRLHTSSGMTLQSSLSCALSSRARVLGCQLSPSGDAQHRAPLRAVGPLVPPSSHGIPWLACARPQHSCDVEGPTVRGHGRPRSAGGRGVGRSSRGMLARSVRRRVGVGVLPKSMAVCVRFLGPRGRFATDVASGTGRRRVAVLCVE